MLTLVAWRYIFVPTLVAWQVPYYSMLTLVAWRYICAYLGGLALRVVEVGGDRDDSLFDLGAEVGLSRLLHLGQHHRGDLLRGEGLLLVLILNLSPGN